MDTAKLIKQHDERLISNIENYLLSSITVRLDMIDPEDEEYKLDRLYWEGFSKWVAVRFEDLKRSVK